MRMHRVRQMNIITFSSLRLLTSSIKLIFPVCIFLLSGLLSHAQNNESIYNQAIDDVSCQTTKLLLRGFDRPYTAKAIQSCRYDEIVREVNTVKENKVGGYRDLILRMVNDINGYKSRQGEVNSYAKCEQNLEEVLQFAQRQFLSICEPYHRNNPRICENLSQKRISLESELSTIIEQALRRMRQDGKGSTPVAKESGSKGGFFSSKRATEPPAELTQTITKRASDLNKEDIPVISSNSNAAQQKKVYVEQEEEGWLSWILSGLFTLLMVLGMLFLYKQNQDRKDDIEYLKTLLRILTEKK